MNTSNDKTTVISNFPVRISKKDVKNLHISVMPPDGIVKVTAPLKMNDEAIRLAVISRLAWIKKQKTKYEKQQRQTRREFVSGEGHYYLGKLYKLRVIEATGKPYIYIKGKKEIFLEINKPNNALRREQISEKWYRKQLSQQVDRLTLKWIKTIPVEYKKIGIRKMKTRWGSCNQRTKIIWLNLELIKKPESCIEYVLVHELCHLLEKHHNDNFIKLMDKYLPKWEKLKDDLNRMPLSYEEWKY